ncbi:uncharacterized protein (TIGR03083 family) [Nakamurella sp. UYEF19]|uniref:maleylpyruvate isomerase N-terminal domain-containing protein n=1 Tax=Nakamurella sp. UYEF19 TaxID=1756392 RepID=UPI00339658C3
MSGSDLTYAAQFEVLRVWIGTLDDDDLRTASNLPGWTVGDLIGHLVGTGSSIAGLTTAESPGGSPVGEIIDSGEPGRQEPPPMTIADYVSGYTGSADQIAEMAKDLARTTVSDLLDALDASNAAAQLNLDRLGGSDLVVTSRRGPILLSHFLDTRLIELVVHSGDLAASLPDRRGPMVLPMAQRRVLSVLRELLTQRSEHPIDALTAASALPAADFIRLAAGRDASTPALDPALIEALPLL